MVAYAHAPAPTAGRTVLFHTEHGRHVGGTDFRLGAICDALADAGWRRAVSVGAGYPDELIFRRPVDHLFRTGAGPTKAASHVVRRRPLGRLFSAAHRRLTPWPVRHWLGLARLANGFAGLTAAVEADVVVAMEGGPQPSMVGAAAAGARVLGIYAAPPPSPAAGLAAWLFARRAYRAADVCVSPSTHTRDAWVSYLRCDGAKFRVIPNGVATERYAAADPRPVRAELGLSPDAVVVGMTGRMVTEKGPRVLAAAAGRVAAACPAARFVFTGDGCEVEPVRQAVAAAGLGDRCRFLGFRPDTPAVTAAYDIAVVPSVMPEPFGLVVAEGMAAGKPVVGSNVGGIPEVIDHGRTGWLVPPADPAALADALARLVRNPDRRRQLGDAARDEAARKFDQRRMVADFGQLLGRLADARVPADNTVGRTPPRGVAHESRHEPAAVDRIRHGR